MIYFLLPVALWLWWMTISLTCRQLLFLRDSALTTGTLIRWKPSSSRSKIYWYPVVSYRAPSGATHEAVGNTGIRADQPPDTRKGFKVRYKIAQPDRSQLTSPFHYWLAPFVFLLLAAATTIVLLDQTGLIHVVKTPDL